MSGHLPKPWVVVPIGDVANLTKGKKPAAIGPFDDSMTIPYVTIKVFETGIASDYCDPTGLPLCTENDTLIVWDGARCGLVGKGVSGAIGSTLAKIEIPEISRPYLNYFMRSQFHRLNSNPRGVGIPHVDPNIFSSILLPLAPLAEQQRIVEEIEKQFTRLDAAVEALRAAQAKLKRYRASVLNAAVTGRLVPTEAVVARTEGRDYEPAGQLLQRILAERRVRLESQKHRREYQEPTAHRTSELPELPDGWISTTVEQVSFLVQYGTSAKASSDATGVPVLRMGNIREGSLDTTDLKYLPTGNPEVKKTLLDHGDLLFNRTNSAELVGKSAVFKGESSPASFASYLIRVSFGDGFSSEFGCLYINSHLGRNYIARVRNQQVGQANVNGTKLAAMPIPLPPIAEQHRIVMEVERLLSVAQQAEAAVEANLKRAERLRQAILKRAFGGRLVPQDPVDEPAAILLERIKTEKAAAAQAPRRGRRAAKGRHP